MMEISIDEIFQISERDFDRKYELIEIIASGSFGTVNKAREKNTNKIVAVKIISKESDNDSAVIQLKREIYALKKARHANIVRLFDFFETKDKIYIVMEYIKNGTLTAWMKNRPKITEGDTKTIIYYILNAIDYLHKIGICHRDIKPDNIMFDGEDLSSLKVIDFGLSSQSVDQNNFEFCGTLLFMSPERIMKKCCSMEIDIWSIGIIMFMLLNKGMHPFHRKGDSREQYINRYIDLKITPFYPCTPIAINLIEKLLDVNPKYRYTASFALQHCWFKYTKKIINDIKEKARIALFAAIFFSNNSNNNQNQKDTSSDVTSNDKDKSCEDEILSTKGNSSTISTMNNRKKFVFNPMAHTASTISTLMNKTITKKKSLKTRTRIYLLDKVKDKDDSDLIRNLDPKRANTFNSFLYSNNTNESRLTKKRKSACNYINTENYIFPSKKFNFILYNPKKPPITLSTETSNFVDTELPNSSDRNYQMRFPSKNKTSKNLFCSSVSSMRSIQKINTFSYKLSTNSNKSSILLPSILNKNTLQSKRKLK